MPDSAVGLPEILRLNGYATGCFGKWHNTPATEVSAAGPFERWPTGSTWGCDTFYGFMAGETDQYYPVLYRNTSPINPPRTPEQGYSFSEDMADETIAWINNVGATNPNKPWFVYLAPPGVHEPHQAPKEYRDKYKGRFDAGWDRYREDTFARQKKLGVVPADAKLTPRPKEIPAWDESIRRREEGLCADDGELRGLSRIHRRPDRPRDRCRRGEGPIGQHADHLHRRRQRRLGRRRAGGDRQRHREPQRHPARPARPAGEV